ncbi:MAG: SDR family oxidoreductase [Pseudomonadota bacterium]
MRNSPLISYYALALVLGCLLQFASPGYSAEPSKGTVLITGANRGIGLALAEQFTERKFNVIGTARNTEKAQELKALGATVEQLDVTDQASVDALKQRLNGQAIDILINNAGIVGHTSRALADLDIDKLSQVYEVNALGPLRVIQALFANVESSEQQLVINISSTMGSIERNTWGSTVGYRASKAALNMINKTMAVDYGKQGLTFVVMHPGYVKTDMNAGEGQYTAEQSAAGLTEVISGLSHENNGMFFDHLGKELPW